MVGGYKLEWPGLSRSLGQCHLVPGQSQCSRGLARSFAKRKRLTARRERRRCTVHCTIPRKILVRSLLYRLVALRY